MTEFSDLITEIKMECASAPDPVIEQAIRNTVIDLCNRTGIVKRMLDPITIQPGQPFYTVTPPLNMSIVDIVNAQINDRDPLEPASVDRLDLWWRENTWPNRLFSGGDLSCPSDSSVVSGDSWRQLTQDFPMVFYIDRQNNDFRMRLVGIPTMTLPNSLVVRISIKPTRVATGMDDWLMEDYYETIVDGAKGRILRMPKRPWNDIPTAQYYMGKYEEEVNNAVKDSLREFIRDDQSIGHVQSWP